MKPAGIVLIAMLAAALPALPATCESVAQLAFPGATITRAHLAAAGAFQPPEGRAIPNLPAFCRIEGVLKPSGDSDIRFEVWMPAEGWNGKYQGVGNGGFAGSIGYSGLAQAVAHGYAAAASDTGHEAGGTDAGWALGHPEKVADFGFRAVHETADKAKAIIRAFYGERPRRSYFNSCSNGGRQALMEAQRFPADYDGIIAGAPANNWTRLLTGAVWDMQALTGDGYIPSAKLPAIEAATLKACDTADGLPDGLIDNPARCHFDPAVLRCQGAESDACLTGPQVEALRKIYGGPQTGKGASVFPGYPPGGQTGPGGWAAWITGAGPGKSLLYAFGTQFYQNMVFGDPSWDYRTFSVDRDMKVAQDKVGRLLDATDPDLARFRQRGGKLILYHGWSDAAIPAPSTIDYYRSVVSKLGAQSAESFVRLYLVPGMQHCGGGPGPNTFGQFGVADGDARHNIDSALEQWVEKGTAPAEIVASGNGRTRPLCPYPQTAHYKGSGSPDDAASFSCK